MYVIIDSHPLRACMCAKQLAAVLWRDILTCTIACACPSVHVHVYTCEHVPYVGGVHPSYTAAWAGEHVPVDKQCVVCRFEVIKYFVSIMQLITAWWDTSAVLSTGVQY